MVLNYVCNSCICFDQACSKSAIKSSTCSSPTEKRNKPSVIPRFSRSSLRHGGMGHLLQDRRELIRLRLGLLRKRDIRTFSTNAFAAALSGKRKDKNSPWTCRLFRMDLVSWMTC